MYTMCIAYRLSNASAYAYAKEAKKSLQANTDRLWLSEATKRVSVKAKQIFV